MEFTKLLREVAPKYLGVAAGAVAGAVGLATCAANGKIMTRAASEKMYYHGVMRGECEDAQVTTLLRRRVDVIDGRAAAADAEPLVIEILTVRHRAAAGTTRAHPHDAVPYIDAAGVHSQAPEQERAWLTLSRGGVMYSSGGYWMGAVGQDAALLADHWRGAPAVHVTKDGARGQRVTPVDADGEPLPPSGSFYTTGEDGVVACRRPTSGEEIGYVCTGDLVAAVVLAGAVGAVGLRVARRVVSAANVDRFRANPLRESSMIGARTALYSLPAAIVMAPFFARWEHWTRVLSPDERVFGDGTRRWPKLPYSYVDVALMHSQYVLGLFLMAVPLTIALAFVAAPVGAASGAVFYAHRVRPLVRKQVAVATAA